MKFRMVFTLILRQSTSVNLLRLRGSIKVILSSKRALCQDPPESDDKIVSVPEKKEHEADKNKNEKQEEAKIKMNELLKSLSQNPDYAVSKLTLSQPKPRRKKKKMSEAVDKDPYVDMSLKKAVKDVAEKIGGDIQEIESELFSALKSHSTEKSLSDLLSGMKIDRNDNAAENEMHFPYSQHPVRTQSGVPRSRLKEFSKTSQVQRQAQPVDLYSGAPLGIFPPPKHEKTTVDDSALATWDKIYKREMMIAVSQQPRNAFEEMIQWTEEGKLWPFPIDNEYGLEEEKSFGFADHIFLERHLEDWCPKKGPVRHFMELVCVGLSKNPHLTVARKKAHIEWYRKYFEEKKSLLQELGAL